MEIRWYYTVIRRSWRLLLAGILVPGLVALLVSLIVKPIYRAQSEVALYKTQYDLIFDPRITTLTEDQLVHYSNPDARRNTLESLATSDQVRVDTLAALPTAWRGDWSLQKLKDDTGVDSSGNLLHLSVRADNPEQAAAISNAWAQTFVTTANRTFSQPANSADPMIAQLNATRSQYQAAQLALENFLGDNQIDELSLTITQTQQAIQGLQNSYQKSADTTLEAWLQARQKLPLLVGQAQALHTQLESLTETEAVPLSSQVAGLLLEASGLTTGAGLPGQFQLVLPSLNTPVSRTEALQALDQLLKALDQMQTNLDSMIDQYGSNLLTNPELAARHGEEIRALQAKIDPLKAALEKENARLKELTDARDLAWENTQTLERKVSELTIAGASTDTEVVIAAQAVPPQKPASPKIALNTAIGAVLGLLVTLGFIFLRAQIEGIA